MIGALPEDRGRWVGMPWTINGPPIVQIGTPKSYTHAVGLIGAETWPDERPFAGDRPLAVARRSTMWTLARASKVACAVDRTRVVHAVSAFQAGQHGLDFGWAMVHAEWNGRQC